MSLPAIGSNVCARQYCLSNQSLRIVQACRPMIFVLVKRVRFAFLLVILDIHMDINNQEKLIGVKSGSALTFFQAAVKTTSKFKKIQETYE